MAAAAAKDSAATRGPAAGCRVGYAWQAVAVIATSLLVLRSTFSARPRRSHGQGEARMHAHGNALRRLSPTRHSMPAEASGPPFNSVINPDSIASKTAAASSEAASAYSRTRFLHAPPGYCYQALRSCMPTANHYMLATAC